MLTLFGGPPADERVEGVWGNREVHPAEKLRFSNSCDQPLRYADRAECLRVDACVARPALGDRHPVPLHDVLVLEARAAHLRAAGVNDESVVEDHGADVPHVDLGGRRLDAPIA